ncbi:MAG: class I SAM-dependent methyltransferase [Nanoarchaeota archaeon]|nr:class I SAM-dependent methyltransferase [Nanoarchaeota archaeon]
MKEKFFEGSDFGKGEFKALMPAYYPKKYKEYIEEETKLLKAKLAGENKVLEAGVGIGRLIPCLSPIVKELTGVDNADLMLQKSNEIAAEFSNVKIIRGELENLSNIFPERYFDFSICIWNTLGNVKDEVRVLRGLSRVTKKSIFITVYIKGTLKDRENWYKSVGIPISRIDKKNEIFYSESGLRSKSYSLKDIQKIAKASKLKIKDSTILAEVILWIELGKR